MKKLLFILPLLAITALAACSKERVDDRNEDIYQLKAGDETLGIIWGGMAYWGDMPDTDVARITMILGENMTEGNTVEFEMYVPRGHTRLVAGTYTLTESAILSGTFAWGDVLIGEGTNFNDPEAYDYYEVRSGTVKVDLSGTIYTIAINCLLDNGHWLTGNYEGALVWEDWSGGL